MVPRNSFFFLLSRDKADIYLALIRPKVLNRRALTILGPQSRFRDKLLRI